MRARNREVNIFNMSLLDILTGMLGAFLFLMLGLIPYYTKAKNNNSQNSDQTPPVDTVMNVVAHWNTAAKLDIFLLSKDGSWSGANLKSMPLSRMAKIKNNCCMSGWGWGSASVYSNTGDKILLACSLQPGDPLPATLMMSFTMTGIESDPQGSGLKSYSQDVYGTSIGIGGAETGKVYGLYWITATRDQTKQEYFRQYDFDANPVKPGDRLPRGVLPPPPSSAPAAPAPTTSSSNNSTPSFPFSTAPTGTLAPSSH